MTSAGFPRSNFNPSCGIFDLTESSFLEELKPTDCTKLTCIGCTEDQRRRLHCKGNPSGQVVIRLTAKLQSTCQEFLQAMSGGPGKLTSCIVSTNVGMVELSLGHARVSTLLFNLQCHCYL